MNELSKKSGPDGNVMILRDGSTDELFSDLADNVNLSKLWQQPEVLSHAKGPDGKLASREVYSIATQELPPAKEGERPTYRFLQVRGVEDPEVAGAVHGLKLKSGQWFERTGGQVVLGEGIANTLGVQVGGEFEARAGLTWKVVGIMDSRGSPFDSELWAKREEVGRYFGKDNATPGQEQRFFTSIVVQTKDAGQAEKLSGDLQNRQKDVRINALPERKYYEEMSKTNAMFAGAAIFIAIIMAIGGMFGLMNTMFAAVSQRIKDIGVLRIVGYKRWQVLGSFLIESMLSAILGGGLGMLVGYLFNGVEQVGFMSAGQGGGKTIVFTMLVNWDVFKMAIGFTLVMGLLGGFLPSLAAMRQRPLEALR
jgi:putative ABC transport system permease protein